ncbi:apolipoprotein N-acyltransferase [Futiania mangrovi]|uniref:Apolipoprotein N-acyltransferase n=1 Tax=Futiania mangrovi TaxID=2959716 RepID=A0A9J6PDJ2_9PROT|nr:apolipoprotein N-acyltransferase [Futiania mangrovii]MCP1336422.1 apolipoprotein N-acyltransferase [Futiania mangrovii]
MSLTATRSAPLVPPVRILAGQGRFVRALVPLLAGALLALALAPAFAWPLIFLCWPLLALSIEASAAGPRPVRAAALAGWLFGFGYFVAGLFWIGEAFLVDAERFAILLPVAVAGLPAGLALFWGAAAGLAAWAGRTPAMRLAALWGALVLAEALRMRILTGFPWNLPAHVWAGSDPMMQTAALLGLDGLTAWTLGLALLPALLLVAEASPARRAAALLLPALLLGAQAGFGYWRLPAGGAGAADPDAPVVRIVQPNIPQKMKWAPEQRRQIFAQYLDATRGAGAPGFEGVDMVVWPESALPFLLDRTPEALEAIAATLGGAWLVTGQQRMEEGADDVRTFFNSVMSIAPDGRIAAVYDKAHLVPFGEYLPLQPLMEAIGITQLTGIRGGFTPGGDRQGLLRAGSSQTLVAPLVCYEILFGGRIASGQDRPRAIVNVTNDAWFGTTTGPYQHLAAARLRAVIEGLPVVRAANTGVSALIDSHGRLRAAIPLATAGARDVALPPALPRPAGPAVAVPAALAAALVVIGLAVLRGHQRRTSRRMQKHA